MIAKRIPMNVVKKSSFIDLVKYLIGPQGNYERVGEIRTTNCHSNDAEIAALEVFNTQAQNTRAASDKTYHLLFSFRNGECPDEAALRAIEDTLCRALGFADHQRVSVVHHDTDNLHVHVAINKIHPSRYTVHEPYFDFRTLAATCAALEIEFNLQPDNHVPSKPGVAHRTADMEHHAGVESLLGWIERECKGQMLSAGSWAQMHEILRDAGLTMRERANGLVVATEEGVAVKASAISRDLSKAKLEKRLGQFQSADNAAPAASKRYRPRPLPSRLDTSKLYAQYQEQTRTTSASSSERLSNARLEKEQMIDAAKRSARFKRAGVKLLNVHGTARKFMYSQISKSLLHDIEVANQQYRKEQNEIRQGGRKKTCSDWLRERALHGDEQALAALRARVTPTRSSGNTVGSNQGAKPTRSSINPEGVTNKGILIYRVGRSAVRDDGNRLQLSDGADHAALLVALRMAAERYGPRLTVTGSAAFKSNIARTAGIYGLAVSFDDPVLELQRQAFSNPSTKENSHDEYLRRRPDQPNHGQPGAASRSGGRTGPREHGKARPGAQEASTRAQAVQRARAAERSESRPAGAQSTAPPDSENAVRAMPERRVVRNQPRHEMLLPGDVPDGLEQQRAGSAARVRRDLDRAGTVEARTPARPAVGKVGASPPEPSTWRSQSISQIRSLAAVDGARIGPEAPAAVAAAEKYVFEREQKRAQSFDIPKHGRYTETHPLTAHYAGLRKIDGVMLALIKHGDQVFVMPVDETAAARLKRLPIGTVVVVDSPGVIHRKGRSRR